MCVHSLAWRHHRKLNKLVDRDGKWFAWKKIPFLLTKINPRIKGEWKKEMWFVCCRDEINAFYCFMNIVHDFMLSLDTKNVVIGLIAWTKPHEYFSGKKGRLGNNKRVQSKWNGKNIQFWRRCRLLNLICDRAPASLLKPIAQQ